MQINFKSIQENYRKEYLGLKRNTIRVFDEKDDVRKEILDNFIAGKINDVNIDISNPQTHESFNRKITDVTKWNEIYIISW